MPSPNKCLAEYLRVFFCFFFLANAAYSVLSVAYVNSHHLINLRSMIYCQVELFMVYLRVLSRNEFD